MISEISKLEYAYDMLTPKVRNAVCSVPEIERDRIQEIRLRLGRKLSCTVFSKEYFICANGKLSNNYNDAVDITTDDIETTYKRALQNSIHSFHREISRGYITTDGGNRVGFCGTAVLGNSHDVYVDSVKNVSSINIRIAREICGVSKPIYLKSLAQRPCGIIIGGPPSSGKTTILRDLCRQAGDKYRISVIDERNELSNTKNGIAQNRIGMMSDVFSSYTKYDGILTAVKVMSPTLLVCDEIGTDDDLKALRYAVNSGVKIIATAHCSDFDELRKRPVISKLIKDKVFDYAAILGTESLCGQLVGFYKLNDKNDKEQT